MGKETMTTDEQKKFAKDLLTLLGLTYSANRANFFYAWFKSEGTKAKYNPLATTWDMRSEGSTFFNCLKKDAKGSCVLGVQNYPTYAIGLNATIKTLRQKEYAPIRDFLSKGGNALNPNDPDLKKAFDTWGTTYSLFVKTYTDGNYGKAITRRGLFERPMFWLGTALIVAGSLSHKARKGF